MLNTRTAAQVLDSDFLALRARILEIAAGLDRLDRSEGDVSRDPRVAAIRSALAVLGNGESDRAEAVQQVFSLPYDPAWRRQWGWIGSGNGAP